MEEDVLMELGQMLLSNAPSQSDDAYWATDGIAFTHRYEDGVDTCVTKGLYAIMNK